MICPPGDSDQGRGSLRHIYSLSLSGIQGLRGLLSIQPVLADDTQEIADWLLRLTPSQHTCGFGLCFLINSIKQT